MGSSYEYLDNERLEKERKDFLSYKSSICCEGNPQKGDSIWKITMNGPSDSPYMGGKFQIRITFDKNYPTSKPNFEFLTPICHINIEKKHICLSSLNKYNKDSSIVNLLSEIFMMLTSPNQDSAYGTYSKLYTDDYSGYLRKAREMTRDYGNINKNYF